MKDGIHGARQIDETTASRLLKELYENRKKNEDGKVHVHEIKDGNIGKEIKRF
jgi:hypothetical protein